jgi:transcriptional regulator with XRE-family HTH domain
LNSTGDGLILDDMTNDNHTAIVTTTSVGERIATARKAKGWTQQDLADRLGVTFQAVSKWETGASMPDVGLLVTIAAELNMSTDALLTGNGLEAGQPAAEPPTRWGRITGTITKDIYGDTGTIVGTVDADIYGNVKGDIIGTVRSVHGNVEGSVVGRVTGSIDGYVGKHMLGIVEGRVKLGVRGKIRGTIVGDGINVGATKGDEIATKVNRRTRT